MLKPRKAYTIALKTTKVAVSTPTYHSVNLIRIDMVRRR